MVDINIETFLESWRVAEQWRALPWSTYRSLHVGRPDDCSNTAQVGRRAESLHPEALD